MEQKKDKKPAKFDFAFFKFYASQHPFFVETRVFGPDHLLTLHCHDFPQVWYCVDGFYMHQVGDQVYRCTKGNVILIPCGVVHRFWVPEGERTKTLYLNVRYEAWLDKPAQEWGNAGAYLFLSSLSKELGYTYPYSVDLSPKSQQVMDDVFSWLSMLKFDQNASRHTQEMYERIQEVFSAPEFALPEALWERANRLINNQMIPMLRVVDYLNIRYPEKITEETLLQVSATCHANLYRYFRNLLGCTYSQYLQQLRMKHAYCYLFHSRYSLAYISDVCGFYDLPHMTQVFRKYMGDTPRQFRLIKQRYREENPDRPIKVPPG